MGPNLAKSTLGQGIRPRPAPLWPVGALVLCAWVRVSPVITARLKACTSSCEIRPLGPLPLTSFKGTPSSRANLRTEGEAWGKPASLRGPSARGNPVDCFASVTASPEGAAVAMTGGTATTGGAVTARPEAEAASTNTITEPRLTLSPSWTRISLTTPA